MPSLRESLISQLLRRNQAELLTQWLAEQSKSRRVDLISESELREQSREFLNLLATATAEGDVGDIDSPAFGPVRDMLGGISRSRSLQ